MSAQPDCVSHQGKIGRPKVGSVPVGVTRDRINLRRCCRALAIEIYRGWQKADGAIGHCQHQTQHKISVLETGPHTGIKMDSMRHDIGAAHERAGRMGEIHRLGIGTTDTADAVAEPVAKRVIVPVAVPSFVVEDHVRRHSEQRPVLRAQDLGPYVVKIVR